MTDIPVAPGGVPAFFVKVGGEHLRVTEGSTSSSMGDRSYASFTLDLRYLAAIDLTSPVQLVQKGTVQAGLRVTFAKYKGYSRTTPQFLTKWNF